MKHLRYLLFATIIISCKKETKITPVAKFDFTILNGSWVKKSTIDVNQIVVTDSLFFDSDKFSYVNKVEMKESLYGGMQQGSIYYRLGVNSLSNYLYTKANGDQIRQIVLKNCEGKSVIDPINNHIKLIYDLDTGVDPSTGLKITTLKVNTDLQVIKLTNDSLIVWADRDPNTEIPFYGTKAFVRTH